MTTIGKLNIGMSGLYDQWKMFDLKLLLAMLPINDLWLSQYEILENNILEDYLDLEDLPDHVTNKWKKL